MLGGEIGAVGGRAAHSYNLRQQFQVQGGDGQKSASPFDKAAVETRNAMTATSEEAEGGGTQKTVVAVRTKIHYGTNRARQDAEASTKTKTTNVKG